MPMVSRSHFTQAISVEIEYTKHVRRNVAHLINSDNAKEYLGATTIGAVRELGTNTKTIAPHNPEKNGVAASNPAFIMVR